MKNYFTVDIDPLDRSEMLRYLACAEDAADERLENLLESCGKKVIEASGGKFTFRAFDIEENTGSAVTLRDCALVMEGKDISSHLKGCKKAVLLCATIGGGADKLIRALQKEDMAQALAADSAASCAVEQVCGKAEEVIRNSYPDMYMTWRFSAGYGDFPIEVQRLFLEVTNAGRTIGLFANESHVLTPKKSVTAVIGLSESPVENKRRGCASCNMRESCAFRKRGSRCTDG